MCWIFGGCRGYNKKVITELADVREICRFPDVSPEEWPGLPSNREIEFEIELLSGTALIPKAPYRMTQMELKELK